MPRGRPRKNKEVPLSPESEKKVKQGLQEAKEGKIERLDPKELEPNPNLNKVVNELSKRFGSDIFHLASEEPDKERIPFGIDQFDKMVGGGIPLGLFTVLWGNKSAAKTTLAYMAVAQAQQKGKQCFFIDLEGSFDKAWASKMGVQLDKLLIARFKNAEEVMDTIIKLTNEKAVDFIVLDSVQSLSPKGEQETKQGKEKSVEDDTMALLARKLSQFLRMSASGVAKGKVGILLIGQARTDLGSFIKFDTLSGGHALHHWASMTIKTYRGTKADAPRYKFKVDGKTKELIIGFDLCLRLEKTKSPGTAPENTTVRIPFYYEYGFNKPTDKQITDLYEDWISFEGDSEE